MADYYEILQVHPKADAEAIRAAYERLRERYDPARLEGAADELIELARRRRDEIERAYQVLGDPWRRAEYDQLLKEQINPSLPVPEGKADTSPVGEMDDDLIDFRPLPPARRQERPPDFNPQPYLSPRSQQPSVARGRVVQRQQPVWLLPSLVVAATTFSIVLGTLISTTLVAPPPAAPTTVATIVPPTPTLREILDQFEGQVIAAQQVTTQVPDNPNAWINLGNALFDSVVFVREQLTNGNAEAQQIYQERLPRWLEAVDAYRKALELEPSNDVIRADIAASLCYYGLDTNNPQRAAEGLSEAEKALQAAPQNARVLLSHGICLVAVDPPQTERAIQQWQLVLSIPGVAPGLQLQAQILIDEYGQ